MFDVKVFKETNGFMALFALWKGHGRTRKEAKDNLVSKLESAYDKSLRLHYFFTRMARSAYSSTPMTLGSTILPLRRRIMAC